MTTSAHRVPGLRAWVVRAPSGPRVVRVVHGHRHLRLWHRRLVLGALLGGAMAGALLGVVWAVRTVGTSDPLLALQAYGIGAGAGATAGTVLGILLSVLAGMLDRYVRPQRVPVRRAWVRYRR